MEGLSLSFRLLCFFPPTFLTTFSTLSSNPVRVLLLSAYEAASHKRWREGLVRHLSDWTWTVLSLPPRFFSWRIRGNPMTWAFMERETLEQDYDLLVATSMTDVAMLRGLVPSISRLPTVVYFHENQFVYPVRKEVNREVLHFCMHNLYNGLAADRLLFNSHYNRSSYLEGATDLLRRLPDYVPKNIVSLLSDKSEVVPVPLEDFFWEKASSGPEKNEQPFTLVWNHRWEYDKAPERFFRALQLLREAGVPFQLHVVGQQFRKQPPCFAEARETLEEHIVSWGFLPEASDYYNVLMTSDVAVSAALHEFQGLALLEAAVLGCVPLAPDRLAYQDWVPETYRYPSFPDDAEQESQALFRALHSLYENLGELRQQKPVRLEEYAWSRMQGKYRGVLEKVVVERSGGC